MNVERELVHRVDRLRSYRGKQERGIGRGLRERGRERERETKRKRERES